MTRWNREAIIAVLQKVYQEHGYCTSYQWMRDRRSPHFYTIIHFFGSWHAAWQAAGYDVPHRLAPKDRIVTRDLVVEALKTVGHFESERTLGNVPHLGTRIEAGHPPTSPLRHVIWGLMVTGLLGGLPFG